MLEVEEFGATHGDTHSMPGIGLYKACSAHGLKEEEVHPEKHMGRF